MDIFFYTCNQYNYPNNYEIINYSFKGCLFFVLLLLLLLSLLLLLFVFNIYVLAVVIRHVTTNDQSLTEYSHLYICNALLSILAVPNKALFCITPTLHVMPSFPIHLSTSAETLPRTPFTKGTISTFSISTIF